MPNNVEWIPILTELSEEELARIFDKSPDVTTALLEAHENVKRAKGIIADVKKMGHEDE